jgi:hypothetical protein
MSLSTGATLVQITGKPRCFSSNRADGITNIWYRPFDRRLGNAAKSLFAEGVACDTPHIRASVVPPGRRRDGKFLRGCADRMLADFSSVRRYQEGLVEGCLVSPHWKSVSPCRS